MNTRHQLFLSIPISHSVAIAIHALLHKAFLRHPYTSSILLRLDRRLLNFRSERSLLR